jgi:hypothetical protein
MLVVSALQAVRLALGVMNDLRRRRTTKPLDEQQSQLGRQAPEISAGSLGARVHRPGCRLASVVSFRAELGT